MAKQAQSKEKILDKMLKSGLTEKVRLLCYERCYSARCVICIAAN
jgi:hypothetical protein